jgi:hypothetical protein
MNRLINQKNDEPDDYPDPYDEDVNIAWNLDERINPAQERIDELENLEDESSVGSED